jgi:hypothetical protein
LVGKAVLAAKTTYDTCPEMGRLIFVKSFISKPLMGLQFRLLHDGAFFWPVVCLDCDYPELSLKQAAKTLTTPAT